MPADQSLIQRQTALTRSQTIVPYLTPDEVNSLASAVAQDRHGERDELLIRLLFQTGLRVSEALQITLAHLQAFEGRPVIGIIGKGRKPRLVACPKHLTESLQAYAFRHKLEVSDRVFPINRKRAHQIITGAGKKAGLTKRVYPHLLRHSDAIERLKQTGNPKALQIHLGHASPFMTMRYLSTLTARMPCGSSSRSSSNGNGLGGRGIYFRSGCRNNMQPKHYRIFADVPDEIDETWQHGAILGGMAEGGYDRLTIADSYKLAGDLLVEQVLNGLDGYELVYPILFNYRQCLELYLKITVEPAPRSHDLSELVNGLQEHVKSHYGLALPRWFTDAILEFDEFDPYGTAFRYDDAGIVSKTTRDTGEFWVDLRELKKRMERLMDGLRRIIFDKEDNTTVRARRG